MQPCRIMLLDHEERLPGRRRFWIWPAARFGGAPEISFGFVLLETHRSGTGVLPGAFHEVASVNHLRSGRLCLQQAVMQLSATSACAPPAFALSPRFSEHVPGIHAITKKEPTQ